LNAISQDTLDATGLIFDCDGTLADTMPLHYIAWSETLGKHGIEFSENRFYAMAGQPTVHIIEILLQEQGKTGDANQIADEKEIGFLNVLDQVEPIQSVVDVAKKFRDSKPMGVGSGSNIAVVEKVLTHIGLDNFFDAIVGAEDTPNPKPAPDVFLEVAKRIGVGPSSCCVYEDADLGLEAARRGGMTVFDIRTVHTPRRITE
jgi:beta-phosphoglucomutase family hydrolase